MSKLTIEGCKKCITSIISEKFDDKEKLQQKLQQLETEKELESAMIENKINYKLYSDVETTESSKCSKAYSEKDQEIACLKESNALLEQKLQCVRFFKKFAKYLNN